MINWNLSKYEKRYLSCVDYFILANRLARQNKYQELAPIHILENFLSTNHIQEIDVISNPYKFIYHGQLSYERGVANLVEAFNQLSDKRDNIMLTIIYFKKMSTLNHMLLKSHTFN